MPVVRAYSMMTSSNGNIFLLTGHLCGEVTGHRWILHTKANDAEMFSLICVWMNGWVNQSWGWWFETPSRPLWRHSNVIPRHYQVPCGMHVNIIVSYVWRVRWATSGSEGHGTGWMVYYASRRASYRYLFQPAGTREDHPRGNDVRNTCRESELEDEGIDNDINMQHQTS